MSFVHLHNRTQFSILDGAVKPKDLLAQAAEYEMPALAITDTCNMYCAVDFYKTAKGFNIKPVFGSELWIWPKGLNDILEMQKNPKGMQSFEDGGYNLTFLVENKQGYNNLSKLITTAIYDGMFYRPRIDIDLLRDNAEGLIIMSNGLNGIVGRELVQQYRHTGYTGFAPEGWDDTKWSSFKEEKRKNSLETIQPRVEQMLDIVGEKNFFFEIQDYGIPIQAEVNEVCRALSRKYNIPLVVTNDCRYIKPQDAVTLDILNCISKAHQVDHPERLRVDTDQQYFKSEEEMRELFSLVGEDGDTSNLSDEERAIHEENMSALDITVEIADRCNFKFQTDTYWFPATDPPHPDKERPDGIKMNDKNYWADTQENWEYFYRAYPPPKSFNMPDPAFEKIPKSIEGAGSMCGYFEWYCQEGLKIRLRRIEAKLDAGIEAEQNAEKKEELKDNKVKIIKDYWERLDFEMNIIELMGFPAYMLIVAEFINWSKDNEIPVGPGRGSAAGSLVAYAMGITDIDPLRFGLLFERFLNPERVSMPDIDVDFCQDRREEAIEHVRVKYGAPLVSQIITYGKLQAKAAIKDVSRALAIEFRAANDIVRYVPDQLGIKLTDALNDEKLKGFTNTNPQVRRVMNLALAVEGMTRQTGVHAAGVVIADRPLVEHAPLYRDGPEGGPVVQYDMKSAEGIGLIKFDFLGLKTLDQIRDAIKMIERNTGEFIDISDIPVDDEKVYKLLQEGDGLGVFQVESQGMRNLLVRLLPDCIDDLIALLALYRPGPLSSGMVDSFIDCKHGRKEIEYPNPILEPILKSTYGSIVYQEQVMQIAQEMANYSLGEADLLRRAMGKKKVEEMERQKVRFVKGAIDNEIPEDNASYVFDLMAYFAGYGFNKSHSAAYGMVSYQTAYLKTHYRSEYMACLMTIENNNSDKIREYIYDCKKAGLKIVAPNVNLSYAHFDVNKKSRDTIFFGLCAVKGVGEGAAQAIVDAREKEGGEFKSFIHCIESVELQRINKKVIENLIKCGAFDWTGVSRNSLFSSIPAAWTRSQTTQKDKARGQGNLFSSGFFGEAQKEIKFQHADVLEWKKKDALKYEFDVLGMYLTGHPLDAYTDVEGHKGVISIAELHATEYYKDVVIAGIITSWRVMFSESGHRLAFITVQDRTGQFDISFFRDDVDTYERYFRASDPVYIEGLWSRGGKTADGKPKGKIKVKGMQELSEYREKYAKRIEIKTKLAEVSQDRLKQLNFLFQEVISPVYSQHAELEEIPEIEENIEAKEMATEEADQSATTESVGDSEENKENKNKDNKEDSTPKIPSTLGCQLVLLVEYDRQSKVEIKHPTRFHATGQVMQKLEEIFPAPSRVDMLLSIPRGWR